MRVRSCCFAYSTFCFFDVLVAIAVVVAYASYCLDKKEENMYSIHTYLVFLDVKGVVVFPKDKAVKLLYFESV